MRHRIFAGLGLGLLLLLGCPPTSERAGGVEADVGSKAPPAPAEAEASDLEPDRSDLPGIRERGDLRILLFGRGDSMLPRAGDPALLDEEMAVAFAKRLDLDPLLIRVEAQDELIPSLQAGRGDLIAAQLTVTPEREERVAFSRGRMTVDEVLVVPAGSQDAPEGAEGLDGRVVHVRPASSYQATLAGLEDELDIDIDVRAAASTRTTVELVLDVAEGRIPLTVADRNILKAVTEFEDGVAEGPTLAEGRELAWAVRSDATELRSAVDRFVLERALTRHTRETYHADLDEIRRRGVLRVLTRNNAINYFLYRGSQFGFEFELMKLLAEELDVRLQMVVVPRRDLLIPWLLEGRGDVIAASLTDTEGRGEQVHFSRPYLYATQQIVRPAGADEPSRLEDLAGREVHVRRSSSFYPDVARLNDAGIDVKVVAADEALETEQLIDRVAEGAIPLTVADSHVLDVEMAYGEKVEAALRLPVDEAALADALEGEGEPPADAGAKAGRDDAGQDDERGPVKIALATRPDDEALAARIDTFVRSKYRGLRYNILAKRYFENPRRFRKGRYAATSKTGEISPYDDIIRRYAKRYQFDWRLMAAQAYVESRFDPNAESWVGARGLFQVMPRTGRSLGFTDLEAPARGTHAGIKYMHRLVRRFDPEIPLDERIYFSLAAYNAGLGHVHDARRLARRMGKDPDVWFDHVERAMLKLAEPEYARQARHGYCRGGQPVAYVRHIQEKYEAYVRVTE